MQQLLVYLEKSVELCFAFVQKLLVNRFEGKFTE